MALLFRLGFSKLATNGFSKRLCKIPQINNEQVVFISGKVRRENNKEPRPKPFPYLDKDPPSLREVFSDPMMYRFDENSKLVIVEGPIAAGKDKFARKLAEELEMHYMPPISIYERYITPYGFDFRTLNPLLSPLAQFLDIPMFLRNPNQAAVGRMQRTIFHLKFNQYLYALLHLLSTGEGVVLTRSFYTDIAFMTAMTNAGYMKENLLRFQRREFVRISESLLRPHLVIYLDIPVDEVQARIKKRNIPYEVNSKVLSKEYLTDMENTYKEECLPKISEHAHLLMCDAKEELNVQDIVWTIESMNFEPSEHESKMVDWTFSTVEHLRMLRHWLHDQKDELPILYDDYDLDVDDLFVSAQDVVTVEETLDKIPEFQFVPGFNKYMGNSYLFKREENKSEIRAMHQAAIENVKQMEYSKQE